MTTNNVNLHSETVQRVKGIISRAKRNNAPVQAIKALESALTRIERNQGTSSDWGMIARATSANEQLKSR